MKNSKILTEELGKAFDFNDVEWRVGNSFEKDGKLIGIALPYLTNRAIQDRLDEVFGIDGWYNKFEKWGENAQLCGLTCRFGETWITKWDGCDVSNYESTKGGLSNSQKRAAVQFTIGRYLYKLDTVFVLIEQKGKNKTILKGEYAKLENFYNGQVSKLYGTPRIATVPYTQNGAGNNNSSQQNRVQGQQGQSDKQKQISNNDQINYNNPSGNIKNDLAQKNNFSQQNNFGQQNNFAEQRTQVSKVQTDNAFPVGNQQQNSSDNSAGKGNVLLTSLIKCVRDTMNLKGTTESSICAFYKINSINDLTVSQAKDCLTKLRNAQTA